MCGPDLGQDLRAVTRFDARIEHAHLLILEKQCVMLRRRHEGVEGIWMWPGIGHGEKIQDSDLMSGPDLAEGPGRSPWGQGLQKTLTDCQADTSGRSGSAHVADLRKPPSARVRATEPQ